jgi:hypothetical protein
VAQVRSWGAELIEAHPDLFHPPAEQLAPAAGYICCGEGWSDLLARLCVRMEAALQPGETMRILQIKEKLATLRVYWRGDVAPETAARLHEAVALAKARSACTCERCGAEGRFYIFGGAYMTRCVVHAQGELVTAPPGLENVHLVRVSTPDGYRVMARRYGRDADSFVDEDPRVLESRRPEVAVTANWRIDFIQAHPSLFDILQDRPELTRARPFCGEGFRDLLEQLCARIETALGYDETFRFVRIGLKMGLLSIRWEGEVSDDTKAKIEEAIQLACMRSIRTCESCGLEVPAISA